MSSPEGLFASLVATEPSRPFVTYYDEATGERTELSVRSLANWVAKTHFLLGDALGLGPGDLAYVRLSAHWLTVPVLLGCWSAGLAVTADDAAASAVAFVEPDGIAAAAGIPDVLAVAPDSAAMGFRGSPPAGAEDYVAAVRPQPDAWGGVRAPAGPADPAIDTRDRTDVVAAAAARAADLGLGDGGRLLSRRPWVRAEDWIDALLAPLAVAGSLVLLRGADDVTAQRRRDQERASALLS